MTRATYEADAQANHTADFNYAVDAINAIKARLINAGGDVAGEFSPITEVVGASSTKTYAANTMRAVSYIVTGANSTITTPENTGTRALVDGEVGRFEAEEGKVLTNAITFATGANTTITINAIRA